MSEGWDKKKVTVFKRAFTDFLKHVQIASKEIEGYHPLKLYDAQERFLSEVFEGLENDIHWFVILKARQLGMCYDPNMRVLTEDLRWVPIGSVVVGDRLVSVDEDIPGGRGCGRKMRRSIVEATREVHEEAFKITMDNGVELIATAQHRHLVKKRGGTEAIWKPVSWLRQGDEIRYITSPWNGADYEDGWFGGILDGEGSLRPKSRGGFEVCVSQIPGSVLDRARDYLSSRGYHFREEIDDRVAGASSKFGNKPVHKLVLSRMTEAFRLVGQTRPSRFIERTWWDGKDLPGKKSGTAWSKVVSVESLGARRMIDLQTSTKTFICEGFVSHNSTIVRALIVFWAFMHQGLRVALVYDTEKNRSAAQAEIDQFLKRLPKSHRIPVKRHNRDILEFENGSICYYLVAGVKKGKGSGGLGRSLGVNCAGCTEISSWGDIEGLRAFERSLAQKSPNRLYIWESTARRYNIFYNLWEEAIADDLTKKAIFIGWWAKEDYRLDEGSPLYQRYAYAPDQEEEVRIAEVKKRYHHEITMEQLAWYRHEYDPEREDDAEREGQEIIKQELPWLPEEAWLLSGATFFSADKLSEAAHEAQKFAAKGYRYYMSQEFLTTLIEPMKIVRNAPLKVWEEPEDGSTYALGADPAYGSSERGDRFVIQVLKCFADGADQVAEFCATEMTTFQFAWVIAHLCGAYKNARLLLEIDGPGMAVWTAFRELETLLKTGHLRDAARDQGLENIFGNIRHYMWARQDAIAKNPSAFHWQTSGAKRKVFMMERLRDAFHIGALKVRSRECLEEMETIVRDGDVIEGDGGNKDDRAVAMALAVQAWESERKRLIPMQSTRANESLKRDLKPVDVQALFRDSLVKNFFEGQNRAKVAAQRAARRGSRYNW